MSMSTKQDDMRRAMEDDLIFRASALARSSRQYWSMLREDGGASYKQFSGWGIGNVHEFLIKSAKELLLEVCFIALKAGVSKKTLHAVVDVACNRSVQ